MPNCDLQLNETRTIVTCKVCREPFPVTLDELKHFKYDLTKFTQPCGLLVDEALIVHPKPPKVPPLWRRAINFLRALIVHLLEGNPRVSEHKAAKRLEICKTCPVDLYQGGHCIHASCGCPVSDRDTYFSKLYWRDGKCPVGYW